MVSEFMTGLRAVVATVALSTSLIMGAANGSMAAPPCGTPVSHGELPSVADCLFILKAAVRTTACVPACICRLDSDGKISTADALLCLHAAVGPPLPPTCDCGATTTTTTLPRLIGTCEFSGSPCRSRFACEEVCFASCATPRNACYEIAETQYQACVARCPVGDLSCPRNCALWRGTSRHSCDKAYEKCATPCDDERCEGLSEGPRFEDTGLTIIDHQTMLEWEKKTAENLNARYTWSRASSSTKRDGTVFTQFLSTMNDRDREGGCYAGHCDWRLPRSSGEGTTGKHPELESIMDFVYCAPADGCDGPRFGPIARDRYWSSTTDVNDNKTAWSVFLNGHYPPISADSKYWSLAARAVRDLR